MSRATDSPGGAFDYLFKLIIIGDSSTGKSTLLHQFIHGEYAAKSHTVGVEFTSRLLLLAPPTPMASPNPGEQYSFADTQQHQQQRGQQHLPPPPNRKASAVKLQIWDSAGQERFRSVTRSYYRGAAGCLVVYDVTKRSTFEALPRWLNDVRAQASDNLVVVVVGNKTDLVDAETSVDAADDHSEAAKNQAKREVSYREAKEWADSQGLALVETSSLTGRNTESPFTQCARSVLDLIEKGVVLPEEQGSGVSYGDRLLRGQDSRSGSVSSHGAGLSFADVVQSGGGVSRRAARGTGGGGSGLIQVKEALGLKRDGGGCC
ncbi:unnamed protein product [Parajaminaea phylloscopi]